jgi:hypothetical protein
MRKRIWQVVFTLVCWMTMVEVTTSSAWYDETHVAIAQRAGYSKWFNAAAPDVAKLKLGDVEGHNHFVNNPPGRIITADMVRAQIARYDTIDPQGHLYGAILAALRNYLQRSALGAYAESNLAYCAHYVGDLSMPLHNTFYNDYNETYHTLTDGIINDEVLSNLERIRIYPIRIESRQDLAVEVARIANLSMRLGYQLEAAKRILTKDEAYRQIGHSASLLKAILAYTAKLKPPTDHHHSLDENVNPGAPAR